jgi:hypothetical protein
VYDERKRHSGMLKYTGSGVEKRLASLLWYTAIIDPGGARLSHLDSFFK